jgi:hypothetical protein
VEILGSEDGLAEIGDHGFYDIRVPKDYAGNARFDRIPLGEAPLSPEFQRLLHAIDFNAKDLAKHPEVAAYLKLAKAAGMKKPFGHELEDAEGADSDAQQAYLVALSGLSASGAMMGRKVILGEADGQGEWAYAPAQHWLEIYAEQLNNGINPESIEYLYPNFDDAMDKLKTANPAEDGPYRMLEKANVIIDDGGGKGLRLNLLNATGLDGNVKPELVKPLHELQKYAGRGVAKKIFVAAFTAILKAQQRGVIPSTSGHTIYTWDLVHAMAAKMDALEESKGAADIVAQLEKITQQINTTSGITADERAALEGLKAEAEQLHAEIGPSPLRDAVTQLLRQPIINVTVANGVPTAENVEAALTKISKATRGINELASVVGIDVDVGDINDTIQKLIQAYDKHLVQYDGSGPSELWSDRTITLFVMEASGTRLTSKQAHRLHAIVRKMHEDKIDVGVVRAGIRQLVQLSEDSDVAAWNTVSGPFYSAIRSLDNSVKDAMGKAVEHYRAASDIARSPNLMTEGYTHLVAEGKATNDEDLEYFPTAVQSVAHTFSRDENFTTRVFVGCLRFAEMAALRLAGDHTVPVDFGSAFKSDTVSFCAKPEDLWDHASVGCRSMHMPRVRPTDSAMYAVMNATCRQMVTMMGNTMAYGAILRALIGDGKTDKIKEMTEYFRFSKSATASLAADVYVTVVDGDVDGFHKSIQPDVAASLDATNPFRAVFGQADITAHKKGDGHRVTIGKLTDFKHFAEFFDLVVAKGEHGRIRLETDTGLAAVAEINNTFEAFKDQASARFLSEYGPGLGGVTAANAKALAKRLTDAAALTGPQLYTLFAKYMPDRAAFDVETKGAIGDTVSMTAPCYFHDHPWGAAFYMANDATAKFDKTFSETAGEMWACRHPKGWIGPEKMDRALYKVRPQLSLAPLATFMEAVARSGADDAVGRGSRLDHAVTLLDNFFTDINDPAGGGKVATFAPMRAETVSMHVAKRVLPRKDFSKRAKTIGKHSTAMKKHLLSSLRAAHSANMGRVAVNTTRGRMIDGSAVPAEWQVWGMVHKAGSDKLAMQKDADGGAKFNVVKNPRERCFGTLIGLESGIARVMLNPALANPIMG